MLRLMFRPECVPVNDLDIAWNCGTVTDGRAVFTLHGCVVWIHAPMPGLSVMSDTFHTTNDDFNPALCASSPEG